MPTHSPDRDRDDHDDSDHAGSPSAEPLLDAAFFRNETSRLLVTVFAYILILAGLFWVTMPYLLRDQISWSARNNSRWRVTHGLLFLYGVAILACAVTRY